MRVLIIGNGQLGSALATALRNDTEVMTLSRAQFDITNLEHVYEQILDLKPQLIFNASALTKVNYCEEHPEAAYAVNASGVSNLLLPARMVDATVIVFSTDYVFAGDSSTPILEESEADPLNIYGRSKWAGEMHVRNSWVSYDQGHIVRTSGVFGPRPDGSERNFFRAIYEKLSQTNDRIEVVDDQFTCVTYAPHLAEMVFGLLPDLPKIVHLTSAGSDSWYGWARQLALAAGYDPARIVPVPTDPSSPVKRPRYSVLGSMYPQVNKLIERYPATKGIADYVQLLKGRG